MTRPLFSRLSAVAMTVVVAGACLLGIARPATAQFGQAVAISELMKPEFINRDMIIFVEGLNLDEEQQVIVESMLENYRGDFQEGLESLRAKFEDLRGQLDTRDPERVLKLVFAPFDEWRQERQQLREQFLSNVRLVLSEQQLAQWDSFLRKLRRDKTMDRGVFSGEHLNLFHVLQEMRISEQQRMAIEPLLRQYEIDLDEALRARNHAINDRDGVMLEAMQTQDSQAMVDAINRQVDLRIAVRDINDHYANELAKALPGTLGADFREKAMARGYSRIFRRSSAEKLFEAAFEMNLDEETTARVNEVHMEYQQAVADANQRLLELVQVQEPKNERQRAEAASARMENKPYSRHPNPTAVEFRKRDDMVRAFVDKLRWAMGEQRFAQLPGADRWIRTVPEDSAEQRQPRGSADPLNPNYKRNITAPEPPRRSKGGGGGQIPDE